MLLGCELRYDESVSQSVRMPAERETECQSENFWMLCMHHILVIKCHVTHGKGLGWMHDMTELFYSVFP